MPDSPTKNIGNGDQAALALRPSEAARVLGVSKRLLWTLTNQNLVPHVRLGRRIVYPVNVLNEWLAERAGKAVRR